MSNIIRFRPAKELVIETSLKSVTLADVLHAFIEQTDFDRIMITCGKGDEIINYSNMDSDEVERLICDQYSAEEEF